MFALLPRAGIRADGLAYPCLATLSRQTGVSARHVRRQLRRLESRGLIVGERCKGRPTRYRVVWSRLLSDPGPGCPPTTDDGPGCPIDSDMGVRPGRTPASAGPGHERPPNIPNNFPNEPTIQHPDNGALRCSGKKSGGWPEPITLAKLRDRESVDQLFAFAVERGWVRHEDHPRFHTLAEYCVRRTKVGEIQDAGAIFTANVKARRWYGSDGDEQSAIRRPPRASASADGDLGAAVVIDRGNAIDQLRRWESGKCAKSTAPDPNAQPPPDDSSDRAQKRTPRL